MEHSFNKPSKTFTFSSSAAINLLQTCDTKTMDMMSKYSNVQFIAEQQNLMLNEIPNLVGRRTKTSLMYIFKECVQQPLCQIQGF